MGLKNRSVGKPTADSLGDLAVDGDNIKTDFM